MRIRSIPCVLLTALASCGGGSAAPQADGPAHLGVIAGNNQVVPAARSARLPAPVVAQAVLLPSGQVSLRLLDALLPEKAYAQTTVNGIAGLVVCATAPTSGRAMRAEVPCASTDALGKATFVFLTDSVAGVTKGVIAAALASGTKVTDSVSATVLAGAASPTYIAPLTPYMTFPATVPATSVVDTFGNAVAFRIIPDGRIVVQDTTTGSVGARTIVSGPDAQADFFVELRGAGGVAVGKARYRINQGQLLGFSAGGVNTTP
jgi:hypothetical protein